MARDTQEQSVEETLEKTDFGHVINENKKGIIIGGVILIVLIFGYSFYMQTVNSKSNLTLANAYDFKNNVVEAYTAKKISSNEFVKQMNEMPSSIKGEVSILPSVLIGVKALASEGKLEEAAKILKSWQSNFSDSTFAYFITSFNLSQVYDDLGKSELALETLDSLKRSSVDLLKSKILLDMARIQINNSKSDEAKDNLNIIIKDYKDSSEFKQAKVMLAKITK